jgi:hypothetical protein
MLSNSADDHHNSAYEPEGAAAFRLLNSVQTSRRL